MEIMSDTFLRGRVTRQNHRMHFIISKKLFTTRFL